MKLKLFAQAVAMLLLAIGLIFIFREDSIAGKITNSSEISGILNKYNPIMSQPGYTLVAINEYPKVLLINQQGEVVHHWSINAERARLLPNGNLLVVHTNRNKENSDYLKRTVMEYDWYGQIAWKFEADEVMHHDVQKLEDGSYLMLQRSWIPPEYKTKISDSVRSAMDIRADSILHVSRDAKVLWRWNAYEHMDVDSCGVRSCKTYGDGSVASTYKIDDWTHLNTVSELGPNKWFEAGDKRFAPENILTVSRNFWEALIIDRKTGAVVWRYSGDYKGGMSGGHEAVMIADGLPGAGNILILDNGTHKHVGESYVLEINPVENKVVWAYDVGNQFSTHTRGSVQRLVNGNTLISEDLKGRIIEVTPEKEIVWEYKLPLESNRTVRYPLDYSSKFNF